MRRRVEVIRLVATLVFVVLALVFCVTLILEVR